MLFEGVETHRLARLREMGFAGGAMLGAIWEASDPVAALAEALAETERQSAKQ